MRLEEKLNEIKKIKSEDERLEKLQKICTDDESLNDALEIAKHASTLFLPGAVLIMSITAVFLNFFPDIVHRFLIIVFGSFVVWCLIRFEFGKWNVVYYDLIKLRGMKREKSADTNRKLDAGIGILKDIKSDTLALPEIKNGIENMNAKFDTFNSKFGSYIIGQKEHNQRLEKILERLAER